MKMKKNMVRIASTTHQAIKNYCAINSITLKNTLIDIIHKEIQRLDALDSALIPSSIFTVSTYIEIYMNDDDFQILKPWLTGKNITFQDWCNYVLKINFT